jgi:dynactin complex subunit
MKITTNEYHDLMAENARLLQKVDELERELKERGVDIQELTTALQIEREENARLRDRMRCHAQMLLDEGDTAMHAAIMADLSNITMSCTAPKEDV